MSNYCRLLKYTFGCLTLLLLMSACIPDQPALSTPSVPDDWMYRQRAYPHGRIDQDAYLSAMRQWQALNNSQSRSGAQWMSVGPDNIGGRITSLAVPPGQQQTIYIGAASGGVFKTTDGARNWQPIFDEALSLAVGDMALAPSAPQIIYVGTGEANAGGGSLAYDGAGIYRSPDGGRSWQHRGLSQTGSTGKIIVHPRQPNRVFAATMGNLFANNRQRGLYRTDDGGRNWKQVLFINDSTGVIDLAMHSRYPDTIYAAGWQRIRRPHRRQYAGPGSGIYRSVNGGDHWQRLSLPTPSGASLGRIALAVAPSRPQRLYASVVGEDGYLTGVYKSDDHGDHWQSLPIEGIAQVPFMWWFGKLYVDPHDAETIYLCGLHMHRWKTGAASWQRIMGGAHVDQHALYIDPQDPAFVLLGNDGGLYRAVDLSLKTAIHMPDLPITQFYTTEIDTREPERMLGGTQDNGSLRRQIGARQWKRILGGDGLVNLVDPTDSRFVYAASQYGNLYRSQNGGDEFQRALVGIDASEPKNWHTPIVLDPSDPSVLYYGAQRVYRSTDRAASWKPISPALVDTPHGSNLVFGTLTSLAVSPVNPQLIYAGADDGTLVRTNDGGASWQKIGTGLPRRWITSIEAHPNEAGTAYLTLSGYRWNSYQAHVFRSEDYGTSWTAIDNGLPEVPANDLVIDPEFPDQIFLATDAGVFRSLDSGSNWSLLGQGLPRVVVTDLDYHAATRTLAAATYGRSMYRIQIDEAVTATESRPSSLPLRAVPNPFQEQTTLLFELNKAANVRLEIHDVNGRLIDVLYDGQLHAGEHRFGFYPPKRTTYLCRLWKEGQSTSLLLIPG